MEKKIQTNKGLLARKCGKMLTGYSFFGSGYSGYSSLAPTKERQSWLRRGSCIQREGGRKGPESQGDRRKGNLILS